MNHKLISTGLAIIIGIGCTGLLLGVLTHQVQAVSITYAWRQVGGNGLGDPGNYQIPSLVVFKDNLYAGTWHTDWVTKTAQIWRTSTGTNWGMVDARGCDGTASMAVFSDTLFAGSWDGCVWSSPNGLAWTELITNSFGNPDQGIARFMLFGNKLYASTWGGATGTEVWRTGNGKNWEQFIDAGLNHNPHNNSVISSEIFNGFLYMGVVNDETGAQLWRTNGITTTAIMTDGFTILENQAISSLALYHDMLYAGTYNLNGVQVWRTDNGKDWQKVIFGFGNPATNQENALEVYDGQLYLAVADYTLGMQVWRTSNGTDWEKVASGGFGDPGNKTLYWDNGMVVFKEKLYLGTINWQNAGEIWQLGVNFPVFMPILKK